MSPKHPRVRIEYIENAPPSDTKRETHVEKTLVIESRTSPWYIELTCDDDTLLSFLITCFQDPSCAIVKQDDKYFWLSSEFESTNSPSEAHTQADNLLPLLNSIIKIKFHWAISPISIGNVYLVNEEKQLVQCDRWIRGEAHAYPSEEELQAANAQPPDITEMWHAARSNEKIEEAMRFYGSSHSWFDLYKAYEVIKKDIGKAENDRTLPRGSFYKWTQGRAKDFEQSAHDANLSGLHARHSRAGSHSIPGIKRVFIGDGSRLVANLFKEWIKNKK